MSRLSKAARTYWRLLNPATYPYAQFRREAPRKGRAREAVEVRREAELEFGTDAVERALIEARPE